MDTDNVNENVPSELYTSVLRIWHPLIIILRYVNIIRC